MGLNHCVVIALGLAAERVQTRYICIYVYGGTTTYNNVHSVRSCEIIFPDI